MIEHKIKSSASGNWPFSMASFHWGSCNDRSSFSVWKERKPMPWSEALCQLFTVRRCGWIKHAVSILSSQIERFGKESCRHNHCQHCTFFFKRCSHHFGELSLQALQGSSSPARRTLARAAMVCHYHSWSTPETVREQLQLLGCRTVSPRAVGIVEAVARVQ